MTMLNLVDQIVTSAGSMTASATPQFALAARQQGAIGAVAGIGGVPGWTVRYPISEVGSSPVGVASLIGGKYRSWVAYTALGGTQIHQSKSAAAGHRVRELNFQERNPEALRPFVGQWVVLEGESIIAHGTDPMRVVADARSRGVRVPYVFYVEELKDDSVWIGL